MGGKTALSANELAKGVRVDAAQWARLPPDAVVEKTAAALEKNGFRVFVVDGAADALAKLKSLIPAGAEVMNGSSTTLNEIGFAGELTSGANGWTNVHERILGEKDPAKQLDLRRKAATAEYFVSGVNAVTENGELAACDASGSRVGALPFAAKHVVIVTGTNKITKDLRTALQRIQEYAFPLENARAQKVYGFPSRLGKYVILASEMIPGRTTVILVKQALGY